MPNSSHTNLSAQSANIGNAPSNVAALNPPVESGIVPNTDFLKPNAAIQSQVDARFLKLHNSTVSTTPGKLKSQRGGTDVLIKKYVAWPQNYVLIGPDKRRLSYDQLDPIQWVVDCLKSVADLSDSDKSHYLTYITDLLQDAADFSFESAKACHAVVLTTMEFDRVSWSDTLELDRLRRQHAQRHNNAPPSSNMARNKQHKSNEKK